MRLVLAKLLLAKADFYLFDEPTNHLDLIAKDWFVAFLRDSKFGFLLVCHDQYFLDKLCDQVFELSLAKLNQYKGNYTAYLQQKEEAEELLEQRYLEQQRFFKKQRSTIDRFRASATKASMVQSKIKALEKVELISLEEKPKNVKFDFANVERAGKIVLQAKNLSMAFGEHVVFKHVALQLERGKKAAIVAPNGMGKTTLLNVLTGKLKPLSGETVFGHNVKVALFEQDQNRSLEANKTVLQEVEDACNSFEQRAKVRTVLGAFLFSGDDVYKKIAVLSGGEKNRVAMVKVLLKDANFLILDEPTNHLDLDSKGILLHVLKQYTGTILFVSHDRNFLNELASDIFELTPGGTFHYHGNYDSFLYQKEQQGKAMALSKNTGAIEAKKGKPKAKPVDTKALEKLHSLESSLNKLKQEKRRLEAKFESIEYGSVAADSLIEEIDKIEAKLREKQALIMSLNGEGKGF
jgi:ATP-binding cassette subfamily F protein 3